MAIAFVKNGGVNSNKAGGNTTLAATVPAGGHASGNLLVVVLGFVAGSVGVNAQIADSRSNTYTQIEAGNYAASRQHICQVWASVLGTALLSGDSITMSLVGGSAFTTSALTAAEFSGATITEDVASSFQYNVTTTTTPSVGITPGSAATLMVGGLEITGPTSDVFTEDTDTAGGDSWHSGALAGTTGGSAVGNVQARLAYKITTSAVAQTYNPTLATARSNTIDIVSFQAAGGGGSTYTKAGYARESA